MRNTPYTDYLHLATHGVWPKTPEGEPKVPEWVEAVCEQFKCFPVSSFVQIKALEWQIAHMLYVLTKMEGELRNQKVRMQIAGTDPTGPQMQYWHSLHEWIKEEIKLAGDNND